MSCNPKETESKVTLITPTPERPVALEASVADARLSLGKVTVSDASQQRLLLEAGQTGELILQTVLKVVRK